MKTVKTLLAASLLAFVLAAPLTALPVLLRAAPLATLSTK